MEKVICNHCGAFNRPRARYCSDCGFELPKTLPVPQNPLVDLTEMKRKHRRKNLAGLLAGALGALVIAVAAYFYYYKGISVDPQLMLEASQMNQSCPVMVDQVTRLDNAVALPGNTFQYNYTLVGIDKSQVNMDTLTKYVRPAILNNARTHPDMQNMRNRKVTLVYSYKDPQGVFVHKFVITPEMYR